MNDLLPSVHPPESAVRADAAPFVAPVLPDRVSLLDRLSLRLGFWLLLRVERHAHRRARATFQTSVAADVRAQYEREAARVAASLPYFR